MPSDDDITHLDLDELTEQITVDAYGDEGYWSFHEAFEEHVQFPITATLVGIDVTTTAIGFDVTITAIGFDGDERRWLAGTVHRDRQISMHSILDIKLPAHEARVTRLVLAHRHWRGLA